MTAYMSVPCRAAGCEEPRRVDGLCDVHYQRQRKTGRLEVAYPGKGRPLNLNPNWRGGKTKHPLYYVYQEMIGRCHRPTHVRYADYGGRGIVVCDSWRADFWAFIADMGERPPGRTLDRIDNDAGYSPENCRWATLSEQRQNRREQRPRERCLNGHEYRPETTQTSPEGWRRCTICAEATRERWRLNKKAAYQGVTS